MSSTPQQPAPEEISGVIHRVNRLGTASEKLFSRLYKGIGRKNRMREAEVTRKLSEQYRLLQQKLTQRETEIARLNSILSSIDEGVIMQDSEGRLVLVNEAARRLLGSIKTFWQSELGTLFNEFSGIQNVDAELLPLSEPTRVQINDRIIGAQLAAVADENGTRLGTIIVLRDMTSDVLSERLKDQFITAISHELRTPMTVIKGISEVIINQEKGAKPSRRMLESLSRNVDILDRMIVELLDISELTTGSLNIRRDALNLEELVWNVVNGLMPEVRRARLDVSVMMRDTGALQTQGDSQRLRWALGHLLQNSIRYTEAGGHIVVTASKNEDGALTLQVVDTGVGISDKDMPHIFERFYRGEARTPGGKLLDPRGLGQGLFIARTVAEAHGGYLGVRSQAGQGSVFTVVLPSA